MSENIWNHLSTGRLLAETLEKQQRNNNKDEETLSKYH